MVCYFKLSLYRRVLLAFAANSNSISRADGSTSYPDKLPEITFNILCLFPDSWIVEKIYLVCVLWSGSPGKCWPQVWTWGTPEAGLPSSSQKEMDTRNGLDRYPRNHLPWRTGSLQSTTWSSGSRCWSCRVQHADQAPLCPLPEYFEVISSDSGWILMCTFCEWKLRMMWTQCFDALCTFKIHLAMNF